ncbi:peptidoglycan DD-metalloendopeptidase family protein [Streptomyces sp. RS10V-4]|uniref:M23 family metallopeptidase n=1 Tax=Streptomyces rhizoryzae TaxID=2932493 RepID=UPI002004A1DC|nr:M23 family metallopeptidase [Streptomyces rhizoryzae]MCK7625405.1 peptidoglycan DD-metalloendopeptidase family protein [Streptomyces rhizoryzae]
MAKPRSGGLARGGTALGVGVIAAVGASGVAAAEGRPPVPISMPDPGGVADDSTGAHQDATSAPGTGTGTDAVTTGAPGAGAASASPVTAAHAPSAPHAPAPAPASGASAHAAVPASAVLRAGVTSGDGNQGAGAAEALRNRILQQADAHQATTEREADAPQHPAPEDAAPALAQEGPVPTHEAPAPTSASDGPAHEGSGPAAPSRTADEPVSAAPTDEPVSAAPTDEPAVAPETGDGDAATPPGAADRPEASAAAGEAGEDHPEAEPAATADAGHPTAPTGDFVAPLSSYTLATGFGQAGDPWAADHTGQDFTAPTGTLVTAVHGGTLTHAGWAGAYGYRIVLTLEDGTEVWFCHLSSMVKTSGKVAAGDVIGRVGATGNATGPHLHLEVRPAGGAPADPASWLRDRGVTV